MSAVRETSVHESSVDGVPAAIEPAATGSATPTVREYVRRHRAWIIIAAVLVVGALLVLVIQGGARAPGVLLGADNPAPTGAKALVEVLRDQGVDVTEAHSFDAARRGASGGATVLLFDESGLLGDERLVALADLSGDLVVVEPGFTVLEALAPGVRLAGAATGPLDEASCDLPAARRAGALSDAQRLLTIDDEATVAGWRGCFPDDDLGYAVVTGPGDSDDTITLVAATTAFENGRITELGNAALAVGLAGTSPELVWYLPGPGDADAADAPTLAELTPGWVSPVMVLLIAVTIVAGVWRGRRFGPLVVERLPVHVPAGETSEGRARLYARGAARIHALDQLRFGAIGRIARDLRLPRSATVEQVTDAAARATGRDPAVVRGLLVDELPQHDGRLVELAGSLAALEADVRATLRPAASDPTGPTDPPGRRP